MDRLSRFGSGMVSLTSKEGKTLDDLTDGIDSIADGQKKQLRQSQLTHIGHEEELWGQEFRVRDYDMDIEELNEELGEVAPEA